jgi:hypothetical protein
MIEKERNFMLGDVQYNVIIRENLWRKFKISYTGIEMLNSSGCYANLGLQFF